MNIPRAVCRAGVRASARRWRVPPFFGVLLAVGLLLTKAPAHADTRDPLLAAAVAYIKAEAAAGRGVALAVHMTPSTHWQVANARGEVMTAAGPEELRRVIGLLTGEAATRPLSAAGDASLRLVLTDEAAARAGPALSQLPAQARLHMLSSETAYRLHRRERPSGKEERLRAEVKPHLLLEIGETGDVREALWLLNRKLEAGTIRLLSLEPGGSRTLSATLKRDASGRGVVPDTIDPYGLVRALPALKGQTALLVGRLDKDLIWFQPRSGPEQSLLLKDVQEAAAANDVALVLLDTRLSRQPGERTWAYLTVSVPGLEQALLGATIGDFYNSLAAAQGSMILRVRDVTLPRTRLEAVPVSLLPVAAEERSVGGYVQDIVSGLTGNVVTTSVQMDLRSKARQIELDRRWVPWLPSSWQIGYALLLAIGLAGWPMAARWWTRIWPPEQRADYGAGGGFWAAHGIRTVVFLLAFVPVVALAAFPAQVLKGLADTIGLIIGRIRGQGRPAPSKAPSS